VDDDDLALFGGKRRKPRDERQLTEALARLCEQDAALRVGFARALLAALGSKRAASLAGHLPSTGKAVVVEAESNLGAVTRKWLRESGGRPDLVVRADGLVIVVEAKIGAGLGEKQLERYLKHPDLKSGSASGGVALVAEKDETASARVRASRHWLGQATWRQFIPELEKVDADRDAVHEQWQELLAIVQRSGDLGDGLVTWDKGKGSIGRRNRLILQSVDRAVVDVLGAAVAGRFADPPRVVCQTVLHRAQADTAQMDIFMSPRAKAPAVKVRVWGKRRPLRVDVHVADLRVPTWRAARRQAAEAALQDADFMRTPEGLRAVARFGPVVSGRETAPQEALRGVLEPAAKGGRGIRRPGRPHAPVPAARTSIG